MKVGVLGATGYVGLELVRMLNRHPHISLSHLNSQSYFEQTHSAIFGNLRKYSDGKLSNLTLDELAMECDVLFSALPHGILSRQLSVEHLSHCRIIDLSADFRLSDGGVYREWYQHAPPSFSILSEAVYGLCELYREQVSSARLIANPGCYTTCSILALTPFLAGNFIDPQSIIIDAKSGVTGAGRSLSLELQFSECNENFKAYKIAAHRHIPEIEEQLNHFSKNNEVVISFTPHLVPMNRGILITTYANLVENTSELQLLEYLHDFYDKEFFIRILPHDTFPETKWVKGSNFFDINLKVDTRTNRLIVIAAIDNLIKGAAGQAIQNMNRMMGWDEQTGLEQIPLFPI